MKRRTRKQWYQYHLERAKDAARAEARASVEPQVRAAGNAYAHASQMLAHARAAESWFSSVASWFGFNSDYRRSVIQPLEEALREAHSELLDSRAIEHEALRDASREGESRYLAARKIREAEAEAREKRAAARRHRQRISYLERSPAIRSAARFLKRILLGESASEDLLVVCFYCQVSFPTENVHLEHKRPICRGGDNRRSNLVLACAACNLKKGRKTHEEFLRELGRVDDAPQMTNRVPRERLR